MIPLKKENAHTKHRSHARMHCSLYTHTHIDSRMALWRTHTHFHSRPVCGRYTRQPSIHNTITHRYTATTTTTSSSYIGQSYSCWVSSIIQTKSVLMRLRVRSYEQTKSFCARQFFVWFPNFLANRDDKEKWFISIIIRLIVRIVGFAGIESAEFKQKMRWIHLKK